MKKVKIFNNYSTSTQDDVNKWMESNKNIKIEHIKFSSCCSSMGSIYTQIMIVYSEIETSVSL